MYLPLASSVPLFLGGMIAKLVEWRLQRNRVIKKDLSRRKQIGTLIACGLVAGSALTDVFLAIPFSIFQSPNALRLVGDSWSIYSVWLGAGSTLLLAGWIKYRVCDSAID
jgi:Ca2+/Na+ antiporter